MTYSSVDLTLEKEEAKEQISERVSGISRRAKGDTYIYKTKSGFQIAKLSAITLPNGEPGSRLRYRTSIISPTAAHARAKATRIRDAVAKYRYK